MRVFLLSFITLVLIACATWASLALWYQVPFGAYVRIATVALWSVLSIALIVLVWRAETPWIGVLGYVLLHALVLAWWNTLAPSHDREWADDLAKVTTGEVVGDQVTLSNVRNFRWRTEEDYDIRWETRAYDLSQVRSVDMITSYWGMPGIAHVLVTFGFDDGEFITFTVEIRRERHEDFSAIGGFFKQFELNVIAADERDVVRTRSNIRGEEVHLYRVTMAQETMRALFLGYVDEANAIAARPRFYHTVTANCTIIVYNMVDRIVEGLPMDVRVLLSNFLPSYVKDVGGLQPDVPLAELKARGFINPRALEAGDSEDFSARIREGVPGWRERFPSSQASSP